MKKKMLQIKTEDGREAFYTFVGSGSNFDKLNFCKEEKQIENFAFKFHYRSDLSNAYKTIGNSESKYMEYNLTE